MSYELHFWSKMYFWSFRTLTNLLGSPRFSVLRGHFFNLNKNWPSYEYFNFCLTNCIFRKIGKSALSKSDLRIRQSSQYHSTMMSQNRFDANTSLPLYLPLYFFIYQWFLYATLIPTSQIKHIYLISLPHKIQTILIISFQSSTKGSFCVSPFWMNLHHAPTIPCILIGPFISIHIEALRYEFEIEVLSTDSNQF